MARRSILDLAPLLLLAGLELACSSAATEPGLDGCSGSGPRCALGTPSGRCGDVIARPTCQDGDWVCEGVGVIRADACASIGLPVPDVGPVVEPDLGTGACRTDADCPATWKCLY